MGRPRKIVDMQSAHNTKEEKQKKKQEERYVKTGRNQLKTPPKWLVDDVAKKEWRRIIKELNQHGSTILLVEQNAKKALGIAHKAYVLETGKIVLSGDAKELMNDDSVKKAYLGE